jgi:hypothetical protein
MVRGWITVGFSLHRVEALAAAEDVMAGHGIIALEEPPDPAFSHMLTGREAISSYLEDRMPEFPEYSRRQYEILRALHRRGSAIAQVDPFMAELEAIHDGFENGGRPDDLQSDPIRWDVYQAEKRWTGALLAYYTAVAGNDFERMVEAVRAFTAADAERGRLRDAMRAEALAQLATRDGSLYVEAGSVHAALVGELRRRVGRRLPVRPVWLLASVVRELTGRSFVLAPGDRLTLAASNRRELADETARRLAAQSLIYQSIATKEELLPSPEAPFPHTIDDLETCRLVETLEYEDCRRIYDTVRPLPPPEAREVVQRAVAG